MIELKDEPALPEGKGMWIWQPESTNGGKVDSIVEQAVGMGLTHVYVRTGSSRMGNHGLPFVDDLLPAAHDAGLRVYGWDFPYLDDPVADVHRSYLAISHEAPGGHRLDGYVADIETPAEGTNLTGEKASNYAGRLRAIFGSDYPLMVAVPRPSEVMVNGRYPYDEVVEHFSAILPMVYWLNPQPDTDLAGAIDHLTKYDKPILPIGQAYDGAAEGGRAGPPPEEIERFLDVAADKEAQAVSFWSWQHASHDIWWAIAESPHLPSPLVRD